MSGTPEAIQKLSRDLRNAAKLMGVREAKYFVNCYYDLQDYRIAAANQQRKLLEGEEPSEFIGWLNTNLDVLEQQIHAMLDKWSSAQHMGVWARAVCGVGPVIASGLLANIDITKAPTVGHIWRFAGLDPTSKWAKGEKRPWNASLKRLCWLCGESFVKVSGNAKDVYGKLYLQRKEYERAKNEKGDYAPIAAARLAQMQGRRKPMKIVYRRATAPDGNKDEAATQLQMDAGLRDLLASGKLPAAALHERSKRWAVKLFLAHWFEEAYRTHYGAEPPAPYPIAILGHAHRI